MVQHSHPPIRTNHGSRWKKCFEKFCISRLIENEKLYSQYTSVFSPTEEQKIAKEEAISGDEEEEPSAALRLAKGKMKMVS